MTVEELVSLTDRARHALRITTGAFDAEIEDLVRAAVADLELAGVEADSSLSDPLVSRAVVTYCRMAFGSPDDYDALKASYDEQKAQLQTATGYTDWGDES